MPIVIDFENIPEGQFIFTDFQNKGVIFPFQPMVFRPEKTISGKKALISDPLYREFSPGPLPIIFTAGQKTVKMSIGLAEVAPERVSVSLRAYDSMQGGSLIAETKTKLQGPGPTPITTPITVKSNSANIRRVELEYFESAFEVIDSLAFDTAGPPLEQDTTPPEVKIFSPEGEEIYPNNNLQILLDFNVWENQLLKRVTVKIVGPSSQFDFNVCGKGALQCNSSTQDYHFSFYTSVFYGDNTLFVEAEDYSGNIGFATRKFRALAPSAGPFKLLILTPQAFVNELYPLLLHKNATSMPSTILTLESIYSNSAYLSGRDEQEKIKMAIANAEKTWGIKYVMLVGDVDRFPIRYIRKYDSVTWGNTFVPSDLYYSALYCYHPNKEFDNWDGNNNNVFGETTTENPKNWSELSIEDISLGPAVAVGRIPASNEQEVQIMVNKIINYEKKSASNRRVMVVTGAFDNPQPTADYIVKTMMGLGYTTIKHYHDPDWNTIPDKDRSTLLNNEMNQGTTFVAYLGHGYGGTVGHTGGHGGGWVGWYDYSDIYNLNNQNQLPIILAAACDTAQFYFQHHPYQKKSGGEFTPDLSIPVKERDAPEPAAVQPSKYDFDSLAEAFLVKLPVGGIAYIGCYTGMQSWGFSIVRYFFKNFYASGGSAVLGDLWTSTLKDYVKNDFQEIKYYWGRYEAGAIYHHVHKMMLFGDPSLRIK